MSLYKIIIFLYLLSSTLAYAEMKCEAGKCGASMLKSKPILVQKEKTKATPKHQTKSTIVQRFNVRTVQVKTMQSAKKQINYGYIVAQDSSIVDVTSWFSGYVEKLYADTRYQKVNKGDPLVSVYSPEVYKAKQDYLNAIDFNTKRPSAKMVQSAKRKLVLLGVSQKEILDVRNKSKISKLTTIYSPLSGWIFQKNINQGSYIDTKKPLYQIVDLSQVWVEVKIFQNELEKINKLTEFRVKVKGIDKLYQANETLLYPMLDPKEATATLRLTLDNAEEMLKPGMYAKLYATSSETEKLVIPRTAAMRKNGTWYAFLATEFKGEYEPIEIKVQPLDNKHFEVISGLHKGDSVVNNALFMMDSDAQINSVY